MRQSLALIKTLKRALKSHGLRYRDLAETLDLSEASVKRLFASGSISLDRLEAICERMGMGFVDLLRLMEERQHHITHLSEQQERKLVSNLKLLLVAVCARNHWSFAEIVDHYELSETECIHLLAQLDRLRLIELLPNNRIRLLVAPDFRWIPKGPVECFFEKKVQQEFLQADFDQAHERRLFLSAPLSAGSLDRLARRVDALASEFQDLQKQDAALPRTQVKNTGLAIALRHWELSAFAALRREG